MSLQEPVRIHCVYGEKHVRHLEQVLLPALPAAVSAPIQVFCMNYNALSSARISYASNNHMMVADIPTPAMKRCGFAECHNALFRAAKPNESFIIVNPDTIPQPRSIDSLITRYRRSEIPVAIVEGRQWPFEHPKEFDPLSLETPWASGAFCLIDAEFYRKVGGMDETYFLYMEDVDLSWQAWLNGYTVLYEPSSAIVHFTGGHYYRRDLIPDEVRYSFRNFLIIARKFFGDAGEQTALNYLQEAGDQRLANRAIREYLDHFKDRISSQYVGMTHPCVKIVGLNCFHRTR
jgi:hypothetical protein